MIQSIPEWDKQIFYAINGWRNGLFDQIMPVFSLTWLLWALGLGAFGVWAALALRRKEKWAQLRPVLFGMALILSSAGITDLATVAVKDDIGRLRPYQSLPFAHYQTREGWQQNSAVFIPSKHRADSFFSGHASHSMAVAVTAATLCPPLSPFIYAMPLVVGYSRIYLGKHYPSDIMAGWIVGAFIALAARRLTRKIRRKISPADPVIQLPPEPATRLNAWRAKLAAGSAQRCSPSRTSHKS